MEFTYFFLLPLATVVGKIISKLGSGRISFLKDLNFLFNFFKISVAISAFPRVF